MGIPARRSRRRPCWTSTPWSRSTSTPTRRCPPGGLLLPGRRPARRLLRLLQGPRRV
ncbi:hypothetical protein LT493_16770 [Streptomyces tricolor]|nr:hypothetical protein [Streptomyces tricolor]